MIFGVLKWIAFVFACAAGVFLTSDCLSEEKREGTLGLLFLTDLRGYDVVLGKLLATSLRTFYSLLAIFPVMALSFVLGGVAADDFWHTLLSLCNALFFSLALGMAISVISRDPHKAMTGAMAAIVAFLFLVPELDSLLLGWNGNIPRIGLLSPAYSFTHTNSNHAPDFWAGIILVHLAGWCFLAAASWLAPRTWHEKRFRPRFGAGRPFPIFGAAARARSRQLLNRNPICWIISRDRWASILARLAILLILGVFALSLISLSQGPGPAAPVPVTTVTNVGGRTTVTTTTPNGTTTVTTTSPTGTSRSTGVIYRGNWAGGLTSNWLYVLASGCSGALGLALEFWLAAHVCRFYIDGKKNGFLELLLVTPTTPADIIAGHWLALRRLFLAPVAAQFLLTLTCGAVQIRAGYSAAPGGLISSRSFVIQQTLMIGLGAIAWCSGLFAIAWFSIWMGITSRKIPVAMLKTFCFVKILPWFGVSFVSGIFLRLSFFSVGAAGTFAIWLFPMSLHLMFIGLNIAFVVVSRRRAQAAFFQWAEFSRRLTSENDRKRLRFTGARACGKDCA